MPRVGDPISGPGSPTGSNPGFEQGLDPKPETHFNEVGPDPKHEPASWWKQGQTQFGSGFRVSGPDPLHEPSSNPGLNQVQTGSGFKQGQDSGFLIIEQSFLASYTL